MNSDTLVVLRKTSLVDYPALLSAVIFFPGCNLRCPWCHNRELVLNASADYIRLEKALTHIEKRKKVLGGVVLSGGEPTLFTGLGELITLIKSFGLKIKLDTNGLLPLVLEALFKTDKTKPDYIAMDLKTLPERYNELQPSNQAAHLNNGINKNNTADPGEAIKHSAALIRASGICHEFRSLALPPGPNKDHPHFFDDEVKKSLALLTGDSPWFIRPFLPGNCIDAAWDTDHS